MGRIVANEKGAVAYATSGSACVDYFFKSVRGLDTSECEKMLEAAWDEDRETTLRLIFQTRDCRGGKGERSIAHAALRWLGREHPDTLRKNLTHVPFFGTWRDMFDAFVDTKWEDEAMQLAAEQLRCDLVEYNKSPTESPQVSLCAKWCPTEKHARDRKRGSAHRFARLVVGNDERRPMRAYRQQYLSPLREYLRVTERFMCAQEWSEIKYQQVPSRCMNLNRKAFQRQDGERFKAFLNKAALGKVGINAQQMFPHELVRKYMHARTLDTDEVVELQWKAIVDKIRGLGTLGDCLVLSDVSGSMSGVPMEVSIALGLLISEVTSPAFRNLVLTFETHSRFYEVTGDTLGDRVRCLKRAPWGGSTDLQRAFNQILIRAKKYKLTQAEMPKRLVIISDMQFNAADSRNYESNYKTILNKYRVAGFEPPTIVFWNVRSGKGMPAKNDRGVVLLSGFSPSLLKAIMYDDQTAPEDSEASKLDPIAVMKKAVEDERYDRLEI